MDAIRDDTDCRSTSQSPGCCHDVSVQTLLELGVCGLGSIGRRHLRLVSERPDVRVHAFDPAYDECDVADLGGAEVIVEPSFERLLAGARDGVIIATPDASHAPLTQEACRRGVAVLVEKPVADSVVAAEAMERTADSTGVPVLVGHVLRHMTVVARARQLLLDGIIGTPVSFHATVGAYETLELATMRFAEQQAFRLAFDYTHEWDYLQHLLGPITRCTAVASTRGDLPLLEQPNVIDAILQLEDGLTGSVHLDYVERDGARRARIVGDRGVVAVDLRAGLLTVTGDDRPDHTERLAEDRDTVFARQLDHFVDVVHGRAQPTVPIAEARRALAVAEAIRTACEHSTWDARRPRLRRRVWGRGSRLSARHRSPAAVDRQVDAGDVGRGVGGEERHSALDVLRSGEPTERERGVCRPRRTPMAGRACPGLLG